MGRKDIIRVGDRVRVIEPLTYVRCGYPLSLFGAFKEVEQIYKEDVLRLIRKVFNNGVDPKEENPVRFKLLMMQEIDLTASKQYKEIMRGVAYAYLKQKGFGGRERRIITADKPHLKGAILEVVDSFIVKTGNYYSGGWSSGTWDSQPEYEPPELGNEKTHKILCVMIRGIDMLCSMEPHPMEEDEDWGRRMHQSTYAEFAIEAKNVEKVNK